MNKEKLFFKNEESGKNEERFKAIFNDAPIGIALIDSLTGDLYNVNPMYAKIAGRSIEELEKIDWMSITHPDDIQPDLDNMARMNRGEINGYRIEKRYVLPDRSIVWINLTISKILHDDKLHPRHISMVEDITERKLAEEKLIIANKEFAFQNQEKEKRELELIKVEQELKSQNSQLKEAQEKISKLNEKLESRVKIRTIELEQQNIVINKQKNEIEEIIKELHHRVKNNMQIISSLLSLQSELVDDPKVREMFNDCKNRVHSMALIHEKMYQSNSLTRINAKDYLPELINDIIRTSTLATNITLDFKIDEVLLGTKMMVPIGLLVNEIVLNSIKHGFLNIKEGKIICQFSNMGNNRFKLILGDDGVGMSKNKSNKAASLGMDIIEAFVNQLNGTVKILDGPGTVYEIEFKIVE